MFTKNGRNVFFLTFALFTVEFKNIYLNICSVSYGP